MNKLVRKQLILATALQLVDRRKADSSAGQRERDMRPGRYAARGSSIKLPDFAAVKALVIRHFGLNE